MHRLRVAHGNHPGKVSTAHAQPVLRLAAHTVFSASSYATRPRVTVFSIAALLVYASSVVSYRCTLRFCLESIQARPRRRFFHRAHNPIRLYIHRLGYPLTPAITCTVKDISRIKRRFLPAVHSSRRVSHAFTYCFSSGSRSSFQASTPRQGISKSGGHPRTMHRGRACN